jgi:hypothetical protein
MRAAVQALFTGDPKSSPPLASVIESLGLEREKAILHPQHIVVATAMANRRDGHDVPFVLCPATCESSSDVANQDIELFRDFFNAISKCLAFAN